MAQNILLSGDAMEPNSCDLIVQLDSLRVGLPVPDGWRVLSGNVEQSQIARVAYRYEIESESET